MHSKYLIYYASFAVSLPASDNLDNLDNLGNLYNLDNERETLCSTYIHR